MKEKTSCSPPPLPKDMAHPPLQGTHTQSWEPTRGHFRPPNLASKANPDRNRDQELLSFKPLAWFVLSMVLPNFFQAQGTWGHVENWTQRSSPFQEPMANSFTLQAFPVAQYKLGQGRVLRAWRIRMEVKKP